MVLPLVDGGMFHLDVVEVFAKADAEYVVIEDWEPGVRENCLIEREAPCF